MKQFPVNNRQLTVVKLLLISSACFLFIIISLLLPASVFAQTVDFNSYCAEIAQDPQPQGPSVQPFQEPKWDELDSGGPKTTVYDNFQIIDVPTRAGLIGGALSVSNPTLPDAKEIADYLEGAFLDEAHRLADFRNLTSPQLLTYNGPIVELTPQTVQDKLRKDYVFALVELGRRDAFSYKTPDINLLYADVCGLNPRTIPDLKATWGHPQPPSLENNPAPAQWNQWRHTWGKYWPKLPLHSPGGGVACNPGELTPAGHACRQKFPEGILTAPPNMRTQGCLVFTRFGARTAEGSDCLTISSPEFQVVKLGIPDLLRLDTLARFTQQLISPQEIIKLYFCKFRGLGQFCPTGQNPENLGQTASAQGETGTGGSPIHVYDTATNLKTTAASVDLVGPAGSENVGIESKFPYLGLTFGKLASFLTGAFKYFDPQELLKDQKFQNNSTKIPYSYSFSDTTCDYELIPVYDEFGNIIDYIAVPGPSCFGTVTEPRVWAGFLAGVKKAKNFVICSLLPSQAGAQTCAAAAGL